MISIATHYNPARALDYFEHDLAVGGSLRPCWLGNFARMLGLEGYIPRHAESLTIFDRLARGCSPSGVALLAGVMRYAERKRRTSYDIVVSAPKSVSIAALVAEDHRILDIHQRAVHTAFEEMELRGRISHRGFKHPTNALVAAHFVHTRSRERDPHLHSHLLSFNMTYCSDPGLYPFKALDPKRIFADSVQLDQIYKNDLAYGLRQLGHKVNVIAGSPEICSVENDQTKVFSKAHLKIDNLEQRLFGTRDNPYYRLWVNDRFRASKNHAEEKLSQDTLAEHWRSEMSPSAREALLNIVQASLLNTAQKFSPPLDCGRAVRQARLDAAKSTLFVSPKLIWKNLWPLVMGQLPWADLKALVARAVASADPKSKPFSSFLKGQYSIYQLYQLLQLSSVYSIHLYRWAKHQPIEENVVVELGDLRMILHAYREVGGKMLPILETWDELRRRALDPAIEEIDADMDLKISYKALKKPGSKAIQSVAFYITSKVTPKLAQIPIELSQGVTTEQSAEPATSDELAAVVDSYVREFRLKRSQESLITAKGQTHGIEYLHAQAKVARKRPPANRSGAFHKACEHGLGEISGK